jgi:two-component system OmpR family sensor kinase
VRIQDSGPGIEVAERERVFDPFYCTLGNDPSGSGLGLPIVKAIAERIGAEIELTFADEAKQSGLCVSVFVPIAESFRGT